jgi:transposase InsO family protein
LQGSAPNLLDQDFSAERPNEKWGADIFYVWAAEGWLDLAVVPSVTDSTSSWLSTHSGKPWPSDGPQVG